MGRSCNSISEGEPEMDEKTEMRRMLKWFKQQQLPPHELTGWRVEAQPVPRPIEIEGGPYSAQPFPCFRMQGGATCERCGEWFRLPLINSTAYSEDSIPSVVEKLKEQTVREAGPCWGDIPEVYEGGPRLVPASNDLAGPVPH
jgi:hypothetical protein